MCGLFFKDKVPSQKSFENFFKYHGSNVWKNKSDSFKDELQFIINKLKNRNFTNQNSKFCEFIYPVQARYGAP
jgi:hypothetical protein